MNRFLDSPNAAMVAQIVDGQIKGNPDAKFDGFEIDSRNCRDGSLFVALVGKHRNGNSYVESAWNKGASVALGLSNFKHPEPPSAKTLICVEDTFKALWMLADHSRNLINDLDVVGITGSNGKTTTKEILKSILVSWLGDKVLVTKGNYNSDIGLPLVLMDLKSHHQMAVLELGMNRIGEIAFLTELARPKISVVTNIGTAHIGHLGSLSEIAKEKKAIFNSATSSSVAVVGENEPWRSFLLDGFPGEVRTFGTWGTRNWEGFEDLGANGYRIRCFGETLNFALPGEHNLLNAMAAVEAALALGAPESSVKIGLENVKPMFGRSEVFQGKITVLRDCYNSNPESLRAALKLFANLNFPGRRIIVLGEMQELGDKTDQLLKEAGEAIEDSQATAVFLFGESLFPMKEVLQKNNTFQIVHLFSSMEDLSKSLSSYVETGDGVLLKGSRGSALERLDEVLLN